MNGIAYTTISRKGKLKKYYYDEVRRFYVEVWTYEAQDYEALFSINNFWQYANNNDKTMNIFARVLKDSISPSNKRLITMEIEYPRFILAELNTHRMLSKNSASSRAIPVKTMLEHISKFPAVPVHWGQNKPGMQAGDEIMQKDRALALWHAAKDSATYYADQMNNLSLAKQVTNRILEPWMTMKTVISGTEWANFFYLRNHKDAQPEIAALAKAMFAAQQNSTPELLYPGEWHVPYIDTIRHAATGELQYFVGDNIVDQELAIKVSASCCAQVSYRKTDDSIAKALRIYDQLINSKPAHASPVEHQATPIDDKYYTDPATYAWPNGVSHMTKDGYLWSGNFCDWIQYRKTIHEEAQW